MTTVTFTCDCPQAIVGLRVQPQGTQTVFELVFEESGSQDLDLDSGLHFVTCRAKGTPDTDVSVKVTKGGRMEPIEQTLDSAGEAGANRDLEVA